MREAEVWKRVPEWYPLPRGPAQGHYEVSNYGHIRRVYMHGGVRMMKPWKKCGRCVGSTYLNIKVGGKVVKFSRLVWETFHGRIPEGMCVFHKNGRTLDNELWNLTLIGKSELAKISASKARRRSVARINRDLDIIEVYSSGREAARKIGYISDQTIFDRCNRKVIRVSDRFLPDGTSFVWEDDMYDERKLKEVEKYYEPCGTGGAHRDRAGA